MTIGVLIPTRGDRPKLLERCVMMMNRQTLQPNEIEIVDYKPVGPENDITDRYRKGYESLSDKVDLIFCIEDDDWYHPEYLNLMLRAYKDFNRPDIFGLAETTYYHLRSMRWTKMEHHGRASMFSTAIKAGLPISWKHNPLVFCDMYLWKALKGVACTCIGRHEITMGIKHGIGKTAGIGHRHNWRNYRNTDESGSYLKYIVGEEDYKFYTKELWDR